MDTNLSEKNQEIFQTMPDSFFAGEIPSRKKKWYYPAAAAAVLVPLLAWGVSLLQKTGPISAEPLAQVSYYVDRGVKGQVTLSDGTQVNLNSGSTLTVTGDRSVFLDGEGWFDVRSDKDNPFIVETPSGISVKVTGTQFNLSNYKEEEFKVLLVKGSIELDGTAPGVPSKLSPSQQVTVKKGNASTGVRDLQQQKSETAWKEGVLVFEDKPLSEAIPMLERWYGVRFSVLGVDLMKERITGEFDTETIQDVMNVLSLTHHFFYNINGKEITIALRK